MPPVLRTGFRTTFTQLIERAPLNPQELANRILSSQITRQQCNEELAELFRVLNVDLDQLSSSARGTDPETSHRAAASVDTYAGIGYAYSLFRRAGINVTSAELERAAQLLGENPCRGTRPYTDSGLRGFISHLKRLDIVRHVYYRNCTTGLVVSGNRSNYTGGTSALQQINPRPNAANVRYGPYRETVRLSNGNTVRRRVQDHTLDDRRMRVGTVRSLRRRE